MTKLERVQGSMIGCAVGDALGYTVEFWDEARIRAAYGEAGITAYAPVNGEALISDDTQMAMFTAAGLIAAEGRSTPPPYIEAIADAYRDWYLTQYADTPPADAEQRLWLLREPALFAWRAPGNTCLSAIRAGMHGTPERPSNHSKGCGGVMRVAPIGLFFAGSAFSIGQSDRIAAEAAALTHGHPLGWLSSAALAHMIRLALEAPALSLAETVRDAMRALEQMGAPQEHVTRQNALLQAALTLAQEDQTPLTAIHRLGEGWVGDEALAIAVYCALKFETDFTGAVIAAVNHKGDSDSTGAIVGQILGARLGIQGIPARFLDGLELRAQLMTLAQDLVTAAPTPGRPPEALAALRARYPQA